MFEVARHPLIELFTYSEVTEVSGFVGQFAVTIRCRARSVKQESCTGCGLCRESCPVKVPAEFDAGMTERRAIYVPFPQAVPNIPVIDREHCRYFTKGRCGVCRQKCPAEAIDYTREDEFINRRYGVVIAATGSDDFDPVEYHELAYKQHPDVLTAMEFERLMVASGPTAGKIQCLSDGRPPDTVVFIQCVGSRDKARGMNYCSRICCMFTAKQAVLLKEKLPETGVYVFYTDLRTAGKGYEEFQRRAAEDYGIIYIRGGVGKVIPESGRLLVKGADSLSGRPLEIAADMVVLSTAAVPPAGNRDLARLLNISTGHDRFFSEAHPKLRPVDTQTAGVFLAGACQFPRDIPDTVAQAGAAAARAAGVLSKERLYGEAVVAEINHELCAGCLTCRRVCPYNAIIVAEPSSLPSRFGFSECRTVAEVNKALCQGCGTCAAACPMNGVIMHGFTDGQILAMIKAFTARAPGS